MENKPFIKSIHFKIILVLFVGYCLVQAAKWFQQKNNQPEISTSKPVQNPQPAQSPTPNPENFNVPYPNAKPAPEKEHSDQIKKLLPLFRTKKDEFSKNDKITYEAKTSPKYVNMNGIYCSFSTADGYAGPLFLHIQYESDDWLFVERVAFSIDGTAFDFQGDKWERDSGNGGRIWEWSVSKVNGATTQIVESIIGAKSAKMKLIGKQYHNVKNITPQQITAMKNTVELYKAFGGSLE